MKVVIIDDEADVRHAIAQWLGLSGFETQGFATAEEALKQISHNFAGVVISDLRMSGVDGMTLLKRLMGMDSALPVIMITGHGDVPIAVEAMRLGAFDFMEKPFDPDKMITLVKRAVQARRQVLDGRELRRELSLGGDVVHLLQGECPEMHKLREEILDMGQADVHALIEGETGTGKTLSAHALHAVSPRAQKNFCSISCAAWTDEQLTAKLFGPTEDGAMPLLEAARGGTLCLEDIETLSPVIQARLLERLDLQGSPPETRLIGICNAHLPPNQTVRDALRSDLFYRFGSVSIVCPPLRQRGEDILVLFSKMLEKFAEEYGCDVPYLSTQETAHILQAPWPGNIRQLANIAERLILQKRRGEGSLSSMLLSGEGGSADHDAANDRSLKEHVEHFEKILIESTLRRHKGNISAVIEELSLPRRTLNEKMAKYRLQRQDFTGQS